MLSHDDDVLLTWKREESDGEDDKTTEDWSDDEEEHPLSGSSEADEDSTDAGHAAVPPRRSATASLADMSLKEQMRLGDLAAIEDGTWHLALDESAWTPGWRMPPRARHCDLSVPDSSQDSSNGNVQTRTPVYVRKTHLREEIVAVDPRCVDLLQRIESVTNTSSLIDLGLECHTLGDLPDKPIHGESIDLVMTALTRRSNQLRDAAWDSHVADSNGRPLRANGMHPDPSSSVTSRRIARKLQASSSRMFVKKTIVKKVVVKLDPRAVDLLERIEQCASTEDLGELKPRVDSLCARVLDNDAATAGESTGIALEKDHAEVVMAALFHKIDTLVQQQEIDYLQKFM